MTVVKDWRKTKTELLGYVPLNKRVAQLQLSGVKTLLARDALYDDLTGKDDDVEPPVFPRHLQADMAEASQIYRFYKERRKVLEERLRQTMVPEPKPEPVAQVAPPPGGSGGDAESRQGAGTPPPN